MASRGIVAGIVVTAVLFLLGLLYFVLSKDLMLLIFFAVVGGMVWTVVLVLHVVKHGIPVRVVDETGKKPPQ